MYPTPNNAIKTPHPNSSRLSLAYSKPEKNNRAKNAENKTFQPKTIDSREVQRSLKGSTLKHSTPTPAVSPMVRVAHHGAAAVRLRLQTGASKTGMSTAAWASDLDVGLGRRLVPVAGVCSRT